MIYTYDKLHSLITQRGVHAEFGDAGEGWGIEQNPHELATFLVRMQELGVQSVLEIGTGYKGGLSRFLAADMGWTVTSVDVQDYGHTFEGVEYRTLKQPVLPKFDLVFIDGDHTYKGVEHDVDIYWWHTTKVMAFHDIAGLRNCEGVAQYWREKISIYGLDNPVGITYRQTIATEKQSGIGWIEL